MAGPVAGFVTAWVIFEVTERRRARMAQAAMRAAILGELQHAELLLSNIVVGYAVGPTGTGVDRAVSEVRWLIAPERQARGSRVLRSDRAERGRAPEVPWDIRSGDGRDAQGVSFDLDRLAQEPIGDEAAKAAIFDAVYQSIVPQRLLPVVATNYFEAEQREYLDCVPRTRFGLHNAFTRAIKALASAPAFEANLGLGTLFGLN